MSQRPASRARGFLSRGALLSLLLHVHLLAPIGLAAWIYGGRQQREREAQKAQEVDVEFKDVTAAELPQDLPPIEPLPDQLEPPKPPTPRDRRKAEKKQAAKPPTPEEKVAEKIEKPKPEQEVVVPPLPPMPKPQPKAHEKVVDLDNDKEVEPKPDAKYLAQKNNRAEVETRAKDTNLEKAQKGEGAASEKSDRTDPDPGSDKQKIAELKDEKSALGRKAPDVTPHDNPETAQANDDAHKKSLLALRDPAKKTHELTPETADPSLPRAADGDVAQPRPPVRGANSDPSRNPNGERVKLALSDKDFEYLFGADAEAERRLAQSQKSTHFGKFRQNAARVRAALENFIPEVKPGNQTALNTRAAPFAAYIAKMHRSIHKLWGFGALEDWDELSSSSPLNNPNLSTTLEMVLNRDGTVDRVAVVRASGYLPFDAAAIDTAYNAGPYPDPPRAIRSANGKIYVHWQFHRDERQCATSGVDYFILDNPPTGADRAAVPDAPSEGPKPVGARAGSGSGAMAPGTNLGAPATPAAPAAPTTAGDGGLRRLRRFDDKHHDAKMRQLDEEVAMAEEHDGASSSAAPSPPSSPAPATPQAASPKARIADPAARAVAERWFKALAGGNSGALVAMATLPFKTAGKDVTKRSALTAMLADLVGEETAKRTPDVEVYTTAGLRAAIGKLPANVDDGSGEQLYGLAATGPRDALILILAKRGGEWKPVGLVRR
ncbi:MAG TPA: TonB family protein [Polyangia bacterium]|jgi:TonB family protein